MLMELYDVAVRRDEWIAVLNGDRDAARRIGRQIKGMVVYMHNLVLEDPDDYVIVSLEDLRRYGIVESVIIQIQPEHRI